MRSEIDSQVGDRLVNLASRLLDSVSFPFSVLRKCNSKLGWKIDYGGATYLPPLPSPQVDNYQQINFFYQLLAFIVNRFGIRVQLI